MSYAYSRFARDLEAEASLRRSRVDAEIAETRLRRSRIEVEVAADEALRRSRR